MSQLGWNTVYDYGAGNQAQGLITSMTTLAQTSVNGAVGFLDSMNRIQFETVTPPNIDWTPPNYTDFVAPQTPSVPESTVQYPATPSSPMLRSASPSTIPAPTKNIQPISVGDIPAPSYTPASFTESLPELRDVEIPEYVSDELPKVPTIADLDIPDTPTLDISLKDLDSPDMESITPYTVSYSNDTRYARDVLLQKMEGEFASILSEYNMLPGGVANKIGAMLDGGVGLPDALEAALVARASAREHKSAKQQIHSATTEWAARGFSLPGSTVLAHTRDVQRQAADNLAALNRETMVLSAEKAIEHMQFAIQQGVQLEKQLFDQFATMQDAARDIATKSVDAVQAVFDAAIRVEQLKLEVYRSEIDAEKNKIQLALGELETYKSTLEAKRIQGDLTRLEVDIFRAQIESVKAKADVFRAEVDGKNAQIRGELGKVDIFRAKVDSFRAELEAAKAPVDMYIARMRGEESKATVFGAQVRAFAEEVRAYDAQVRADASAVQSVMDTNNMAVRIYGSQVDAWATQVNAEVAKMSERYRGFDAEAQLFSSLIRAEEARVLAHSRNADVDIQSKRVSAELALKSVDQAIEQARAAATIGVEAANVGATAYAQMAGAALSGLNASAQLSGHSSSSSQASSSYTEQRSLS